MSVQAGIWNFDGRPVNRTLLNDFSELLKQTGPDGESRHVDASIALLYRAFHTTAESRREVQPFCSRRDFVLTWDGRLDNREELIAELRNDVETNPTDVAIVAASFDRWETDCFSRIIGDWAVSIWMPPRRELIFAIDYMAIRHIFYYLTKDRIWWSTALNPLVLLSNDRFHIDDEYISGYFANDPDANLTPYREIREVPPGQFVHIKGGGTGVQRYWAFSPKRRIRYKTDAEYEEHFRHVFRQSVRRRLRSDSPVLAELSGGLDSSSIVCMADDILAKEGASMPRLDTLSFYDNTEPNGDDWIYFRKVEEKRGRAGFHIDAGNAGNSANVLADHRFAALPGHLRFRQRVDAERAQIIHEGGYRVVLSGLGGDEFLGGIPDPRALLADHIVRLNLVGLGRELMAWALVKRRPWIQLLWQTAAGLLPRHLGQYITKDAKVEPWIGKAFAARTKLLLRQLGPQESFGMWLPTRRSYISGLVLMANKLAKRTSPEAALEEIRYPYLDQGVIEFILSIPADQLLRPGERRSLMRRSLAGLVPAEILSRRTKQFGARTPALALRNNWEELEAAFTQPMSGRLGYVQPDQVLEALRGARHGKTVHIVRLLRTIALEFWLRNLMTRNLLDSPPLRSQRATRAFVEVSS